MFSHLEMILWSPRGPQPTNWKPQF